MRTILSNGPGKGDNRRPEDISKFVENFSAIRKTCGCRFGTKCTCNKQDAKNRDQNSGG